MARVELQQGWRRRGGKMEGAGAEGNFSRVHSRASAQMPRAAADASHFMPWIVQTAARPKKFAAPLRIPRLLEGRFRLRAWYTGDFFSAWVL
jgi:hypothetical protein